MATPIVTAKIKADSSSFKSEVNSAMHSIDELKGKVAAFAPIAAEAFSVAGLVLLAKEAQQTAVEVAHASEKFGLSTTTVQQLMHAAGQTGVSFESLAGALNKLIVNQSKAENGDGKLTAAFQRLGISVEQLKDLSPDQLLLRIADGFATATDRTQAYADVVAVAGRNAAETIPLLERGSQGIRQLMEQAHPMTAQAIAELKAFTAESKDTWELIKKFAGEAFGGLLVFVKEVTMPVKALGALLGAVFAHFHDGINWHDALKGAREEIDQIMASVNAPVEKTKPPLVEPDEEKDERTKKEKAEEKRIDDRIAKLKEETEALKHRNEEAAKPVRAQIADINTQLDNLGTESTKYMYQPKTQAGDLAQAERDKKVQELLKERAALQKKLDDDAKKAAEEHLKAEEELGELNLKNRMRSMTDEEKIVALRKEQNRLLKEAGELAKTNQKKSDEDKIKAAKIEGEIEAIQDKKGKQTIYTDDIRRRGGIGVNTRAVLAGPADHTVQLTQATKDSTKATQDNTKAIKDNTKAVQTKSGATFS